YETYDAVGLAALVRKRDVTPDEILDAMIERIETLNPKINAVVIEAYDQARAAVKAGLPDGPFTGVPYFIKDLHAPVARQRLEFRFRDGGASAPRRIRDRGPHECAGTRHEHLDRAGGLWAGKEPM